MRIVIAMRTRIAPLPLPSVLPGAHHRIDHGQFPPRAQRGNWRQVPTGANDMTLDNSVRRRHAWPVRAIHWISAVLVLVAYLTSELAEEEARGAGVDWHVVAGLGLLLLFLPRLLAKLLPRPGPLLPPPPRWSLLPHRLVTLALLLFVVVQPGLGVLAVWAEGKALAIPFTPWALPPMLALGEGSGEAVEEAHEVLGNAFYAVIALHALAALWHQFVRRDGLMRRML
jgi:cytochrome b561